MKLRIGMAWFVILSLYASFNGIEAFADFAADADHYLNALVQSNRFNGAVLIAKNGQPLLEKGYGRANHELDVPNTPQTKFRLGSITKQFTATCILILQQEGKLNVQDLVSKYVEDSPDAWKEITIHHLLSHTSGIPGFTEFPDNLEHERLPTTVEATVKRFKDKPLDFQPGEKFKYSNSGYVLLGYIIEKITGMKYETVLREKIFEPLSMHDTGYDHPSLVLKNRASGYGWKDGKLVNCIHFEMDTPHAAGALYSTVDDLLRWDQSLYEDRLMTQKTEDLMFSPVKGNYAYGWFTGERFNHRFVEHGGGIAGFVTQISRYLDDNFTVILLSNFEMASPGKIGRDLAEMYFAQSAAAATPQSNKNPESSQDSKQALNSLLKARYETGFNLLQAEEKRLRQGATTLARVCEVARWVRDSAVELPRDAGDRLSALTNYVELTRRLEAGIDRAALAGAAASVDKESAQYLRLDAEVTLLRAQLRENP